MRNAFIKELTARAELDDSIVLVVGDLGFGVIEEFARRFPSRFYNAGVAEQNMIGLCAGLASEGYHVFAYSIANFPTFRCAEQLRNDVDYHKLPVTIVSVGGGLAYGNLGYSHHAIQDFALMRVLPNMLIAAPGDPQETRACLNYLLANPQPSYLRLGKSGEQDYHASSPEVSPGTLVPISSLSSGPSDKLLVTTGGGLGVAAAWLKDGFFENYAVASMPLWGMSWKLTQSSILSDFSHITTVEDHISDAGFGSWLLECSVACSASVSIEVRALDRSVLGMVGTQRSLMARGGLA